MGAAQLVHLRTKAVLPAESVAPKEDPKLPGKTKDLKTEEKPEFFIPKRNKALQDIRNFYQEHLDAVVAEKLQLFIVETLPHKFDSVRQVTSKALVGSSSVCITSGTALTFMTAESHPLLIPLTMLIMGFSFVAALGSGIVYWAVSRPETVESHYLLNYTTILTQLKNDLFAQFSDQTHSKSKFVKPDKLKATPIEKISDEVLLAATKVSAGNFKTFKACKEPVELLKNLRDSLIDDWCKRIQENSQKLKELGQTKLQLTQQLENSKVKSSILQALNPQKQPEYPEEHKEQGKGKKDTDKTPPPEMPSNLTSARPTPDAWPPEDAHEKIHEFAGKGVDITKVFDEKTGNFSKDFYEEDKYFLKLLDDENWHKGQKLICSVELYGEKDKVFPVHYAKINKKKDDRLFFIPFDEKTDHPPILLMMFKSQHNSKKQKFHSLIKGLSCVKKITL